MDYEKQIEKYAREWYKENFGGTAEDVKARVFDVLNKRKEAAMFAVLGLDTRWGRMEMRSYGGRKSPVEEAMERVALSVVDEWVKNILTPLPSLNSKDVTTLKREYLSRLFDCIDSRLKAEAEERAEKESQVIIELSGQPAPRVRP